MDEFRRMDRKEIVGRTVSIMDQSRAQSTELLPPATNDADLTGMLGAKGYSDDVPMAQFAAWSDQLDLFRVLAGSISTTMDEVIAKTQLTERGADALLGVLASLRLITRKKDEFELSDLAREYLLAESPYYIGDSLFLTCHAQLPSVFLKPGRRNRKPTGVPWIAGGGSARRGVPTPRPKGSLSTLVARQLKKLRGWDFGGNRILENQHSRNLPACVAAAHLPVFEDVKCVVDMAGGSGTFAIPFARRFADKQIVLADLPQSLRGIRRFLTRYEVADRVELIGMDLFAQRWPIPECDAVFFGNFVHGFDDERCTTLFRRVYAHLEPGGKILLHELVWNDNKDGPLKTALFNVTMRAFDGRQRTIAELTLLLEDAGFVDSFALPTSGGFVVVGAVKPGEREPHDKR
jgi:SAM-dependent methyltransferase